MEKPDKQYISKRKRGRPPSPPNRQAHETKADASAKVLKRYDIMWQAFQQRQSAAHVSRVAGVSWEVARRAIRDGWPRYGLPPLGERYKHLAAQTALDMASPAADRIRDTITATERFLAVTEEIVDRLRAENVPALFTRESLARLGPERAVATLDKLATVMERVVKLNALLRGEPTQRTEVTHEVRVMPHIERIQSMRDEDLDRIIARARPTIDRQHEEAVREYARELLGRYDPGAPLLVSKTLPRSEAVSVRDHEAGIASE